MNVVLDTNVVVSAIFWPGESRRCLALWAKRRFHLAISQEIFEEYREIAVRLARRLPEATATNAETQSRSAFVQGIFTNVLNPKVALFFLALLPQFIDPGSTSKTAAFLLLGGTFITTGLIWCLVIAFGAARLQTFFQKNPDMRRLIDRVVGGLFLAMGARLAWSR